ncbi:hypothetical protein Daus18300_006785 [Diaporthe australafricana]|uniref:Uncharacterized protein n=1 Tax=Diaporthe australafricana TaxID=127596 RepID=A0ABR3WS13_9PEZI
MYNGMSDDELDRALAARRATQGSPTPADPHALADLRRMVDSAVDDNNLLELLRSRVTAARGGQSANDRKNAMRRRLRPWIDSGIRYSGPKKEGLFLADGSRNPARVLRRGAGARPPGPAPPGPAPPGPTSGTTSGNPPGGPTVTGTGATVPALPGTGGPGPGWRRRDDLFDLSADALDSMGIRATSANDPVPRLPRMPSTIEYNTQAWN